MTCKFYSLIGPFSRWREVHVPCLYKHGAAEQDCHVDVWVCVCCLRYGSYERQRDDGEINDREDRQHKMKREEQLENELNKRDSWVSVVAVEQQHTHGCTHITQQGEMSRQ